MYWRGQGRSLKISMSIFCFRVEIWSSDLCISKQQLDSNIGFVYVVYLLYFCFPIRSVTWLLPLSPLIRFSSVLRLVLRLCRSSRLLPRDSHSALQTEACQYYALAVDVTWSLQIVRIIIRRKTEFRYLSVKPLRPTNTTSLFPPSLCEGRQVETWKTFQQTDTFASPFRNVVPLTPTLSTSVSSCLPLSVSSARLRSRVLVAWPQIEARWSIGASVYRYSDVTDLPL